MSTKLELLFNCKMRSAHEVPTLSCFFNRLSSKICLCFFFDERHKLIFASQTL